MLSIYLRDLCSEKGKSGREESGVKKLWMGEKRERRGCESFLRLRRGAGGSNKFSRSGDLLYRTGRGGWCEVVRY